MLFDTDDLGWRGSIARFWQRTYAADYIGFVLIITATTLGGFIEPFHRMFSLDDRSKSFPHAIVERVSPLQNVLYAGVGPLAIFILWALLIRPGFHKVHVTILGFLISHVLTSFLTDVVKNSIGRPRPDLIARCVARAGTPTSELVTIDVCTSTDRPVLQDGWRSFPSGHSSFAFSGFGFLSLWLAGQLQVFRPGKDLTRTVIFFIPLVGATMIAMSRLADYRHDVYDVIAGSALGMFIAHLSYRRYYRRLRHPKCYEPYPSPSEIGKNRKDEEQRTVNAQDFELDDLSEEEAVPLNSHR